MKPIAIEFLLPPCNTQNPTPLQHCICRGLDFDLSTRLRHSTFSHSCTRGWYTCVWNYSTKGAI